MLAFNSGWLWIPALGVGSHKKEGVDPLRVWSQDSLDKLGSQGFRGQLHMKM